MTLARFAILRHDPGPLGQRGLHWDLMLEDGGSLLTWALEQEPALDEPIAAEQLSNHRLDYLDYEGPVSGNRGEVRRWDAGTYQWTNRSEDELQIRVAGSVLNAAVQLQRDSTSAHRWVVLFTASESSGRRCTMEDS